VVYLPTYSEALSKTSGIIPEFINPKYKDETKTTFKKPTRLECMMQDLPKLLDSKSRVGFTEFERWMCFSAVKNSIQGGAEKQKKTGFSESASSGEADIYRYYRRALNEIGVRVQVDSGMTKEWTPGIQTPVDCAMIVIQPCETACNMTSMGNRFKTPRNVSITNRSTLILRGDVVIEKLDLDGALIVDAEPGVRVRIKKMTVKNAGIEPVQIDSNDKNLPESIRIRGYDMKRKYVTHAIYHKEDPDDKKIDEVVIE
jgi:UDP-sugar pyrophosphorylase